MNRLIITSCLIMLLSIAQAQKSGYYFNAKSEVGYEHNLLKSPFQYQTADGVLQGRDELWKNAPNVGAGLRFMTYSNQKKHLLDLKTSYQQSLFTQNIATDASDLQLGLDYRYKSSKKWTNTVKIRGRDFVRTGQDEDNLLGVPLSYKSMSLADKLDFKLGKRWHFIAEPFSVLKNYKRQGFDRFFYLDNGLNADLTYNYLFKKKVGYFIHTAFHQRNYFIAKSLSVDEEEEEETDNRIWRYYSVGAGMKIPFGEKFKMTTKAVYTNRVDIIQERLGYNQFLLQSTFSFKNAKWKSDWDISYYHRLYKEFTFKGVDQEEELLVYQYLKLDWKLKYALTNRLDLFANAQTKFRFSNADNVQRRGMRSYFIYGYSVGLSWKLKGNYKTKKLKLR